jgi:hypothetical protein
MAKADTATQDREIEVSHRRVTTRFRGSRNVFYVSSSGIEISGTEIVSVIPREGILR